MQGSAQNSDNDILSGFAKLDIQSPDQSQDIGTSTSQGVGVSGIPNAEGSAENASVSNEPLDESLEEPDEDRTIHISVGEPAQLFDVSKSKLRSSSSYFQTALQDNRWKGGRGRIIEFPEDEPANWAVFLHWLNNGYELPHLKFPKVDKLANCWLFGDKYNIVNFQDEVMYALCVAQQDEVMRPKDIAEMWNAAPLKCRLRRNLVEYVIVLTEVKHRLKWKEFRSVMRKDEAFGKAVDKALHKHAENPAFLSDVLLASENKYLPAPVWQRRYLVAYGPKRARGWHWSPYYHHWKPGDVMSEEDASAERSAQAFADEQRARGVDPDGNTFEMELDGETVTVELSDEFADPPGEQKILAWRLYGRHRIDGHSTDSSEAGDLLERELAETEQKEDDASDEQSDGEDEADQEGDRNGAEGAA